MSLKTIFTGAITIGTVPAALLVGATLSAAISMPDETAMKLDDLRQFDCACLGGNAAVAAFGAGMGYLGFLGGGPVGSLILAPAGTVIGEAIHNGAHGDINGGKNAGSNGEAQGNGGAGTGGGNGGGGASGS